MLGGALWPAQAASTVATGTSLAFAFRRIIDIHQAREEKKTGQPTVRSKWIPLDTPDQLQLRLENAEANVTAGGRGPQDRPAEERRGAR